MRSTFLLRLAIVLALEEASAAGEMAVEGWPAGIVERALTGEAVVTYPPMQALVDRAAARHATLGGVRPAAWPGEPWWTEDGRLSSLLMLHGDVLRIEEAEALLGHPGRQVRSQTVRQLRDLVRRTEGAERDLALDLLRGALGDADWTVAWDGAEALLVAGGREERSWMAGAMGRFGLGAVHRLSREADLVDAVLALPVLDRSVQLELLLSRQLQPEQYARWRRDIDPRVRVIARGRGGAGSEADPLAWLADLLRARALPAHNGGDERLAQGVEQLWPATPEELVERVRRIDDAGLRQQATAMLLGSAERAVRECAARRLGGRAVVVRP